MTIDKAKELLDHILITKPHNITPDYEEAIKLGIEALRRIKNIRVIELDPELHHLPGETAD